MLNVEVKGKGNEELRMKNREMRKGIQNIEY
jgi:hypothetical protein